jgi:hypothetical protein
MIMKSLDSDCDVDFIPSLRRDKCFSPPLPTITGVINLSLISEVFPHQFNSSSIILPMKT